MIFARTSAAAAPRAPSRGGLAPNARATTKPTSTAAGTVHLRHSLPLPAARARLFSAAAGRSPRYRKSAVRPTASVKIRQGYKDGDPEGRNLPLAKDSSLHVLANNNSPRSLWGAAPLAELNARVLTSAPACASIVTIVVPYCAICGAPDGVCDPGGIWRGRSRRWNSVTRHCNDTSQRPMTTATSTHYSNNARAVVARTRRTPPRRPRALRESASLDRRRLARGVAA